MARDNFRFCCRTLYSKNAQIAASFDARWKKFTILKAVKCGQLEFASSTPIFGVRCSWLLALAIYKCVIYLHSYKLNNCSFLSAINHHMALFSLQNCQSAAFLFTFENKQKQRRESNETKETKETKETRRQTKRDKETRSCSCVVCGWWSLFVVSLWCVVLIASIFFSFWLCFFALRLLLIVLLLCVCCWLSFFAK